MTYIHQTIIILNPTNETIVKAEIKKFTDILQGFSSRKKVKVEDMGEKRLAYEIKSHESGWYCMFTFEARPEDIAEIERQLRIDGHVLKFMTVKCEDEYDEEDTIILEDYHPESEQDVQPKTKDAAEVDMFDLIFGSNQRDHCSLSTKPDAQTQEVDDSHIKSVLFEIFDEYKYEGDIMAQLDASLFSGEITQEEYDLVNEKYNEYLDLWKEGRYDE